MIYLPEPALTECIQHAQKESPIESCGIFGGIDEKITAYYPMANVENSPEHFSLDPKEQFFVVKDLRKQELKIIGVVHSHPQTPARMSEEDKNLAIDPDAVHFILSLAYQEPVIKAFQMSSNKLFDEIPVTIIKEKEDKHEEK